MKRLALAAMMTLTAAPALAAPLCDGKKMGFSGLLAKCNRETLPPITLASGKPLADGPLKLQSGGYYQIDIEADGSAEIGLSGPEFFRAIWINEVVINGLEVRPLGLDSVEFDDEGVMRLSFIAIKPGRYALGIPGATGDTQRVEISIQ